MCTCVYVIFHHQIRPNFKEDNIKVILLELSFFYGTENWNLQKADQKYLEISEMW